MKKIVIFLTIILLLLLTSCTNLNVIVNDSGDCVLDGIYYNQVLDYNYQVIGSTHAVGLTTTLYGFRHEVYMSDLDLNDSIIYDQVYNTIWIKDGCVLPTIYNSNISGLYIEEYINGFYSSFKTVSITECPIDEIISEVDEKDNTPMIKYWDDKYYMLYVCFTDYLVYCISIIRYDGINMYLECNEKTYLVNEEYKKMILNLINNLKQ